MTRLAVYDTVSGRTDIGYKLESDDGNTLSALRRAPSPTGAIYTADLYGSGSPDWAFIGQDGGYPLGDCATLMRPDISGIHDANVTGAVLKVWRTPSSDSHEYGPEQPDFVAVLHKLLSPWVEGQADSAHYATDEEWDTQYAQGIGTDVDSTVVASCPVIHDANADGGYWLSFSSTALTNLVRAWVAAPSTNNGVRLGCLPYGYVKDVAVSSVVFSGEGSSYEMLNNVIDGVGSLEPVAQGSSVRYAVVRGLHVQGAPTGYICSRIYDAVSRQLLGESNHVDVSRLDDNDSTITFTFASAVTMPSTTVIAMLCFVGESDNDNAVLVMQSDVTDFRWVTRNHTSGDISVWESMMKSMRIDLFTGRASTTDDQTYTGIALTGEHAPHFEFTYGTLSYPVPVESPSGRYHVPVTPPIRVLWYEGDNYITSEFFPAASGGGAGITEQDIEDIADASAAAILVDPTKKLTTDAQGRVTAGNMVTIPSDLATKSDIPTDYAKPGDVHVTVPTPTFSGTVMIDPPVALTEGEHDALMAASADVAGLVDLLTVPGSVDFSDSVNLTLIRGNDYVGANAIVFVIDETLDPSWTYQAVINGQIVEASAPSAHSVKVEITSAELDDLSFTVGSFVVEAVIDEDTTKTLKDIIVTMRES